MPDKEESLLKSICKTSWKILGSYTLGIILMAVLLVLTFYGTIYQTGQHVGMTSAEAAEQFFGSSFVLIPLGGSDAILALPLPGMWIICCILFVNLLIGGIIRARKGFSHWGVLIAHIGILVLLGSIAMGNRMTTSIDSISLIPGQVYRNDQMDFGLKLHRFTPEFYPGTEKPKSYESELSIVSKDGAERESVTIRMNEPLRTHGWTFYQMSWTVWNGQMVSILRGSYNPFEQWPKWASYIISFGLLWHFGFIFMRYLKGGRKTNIVDFHQEKNSAPTPPMPRRKRWILAGIGLFVLALFGVGLMSGKPRIERVLVDNYMPWSPQFVEAAAGIAVEDGGRVKPFSTYAGFTMLRTLGKRSLTISTGSGTHKLTSTEWALDCMLRPEYARQYPVFLVNREEVVTRLGLPDLPDKRKRYSFSQLESRLTHIYDQAAMVQRIKEPGDVDRDVAGLAQNLRQMEIWMLMPGTMLQHPSSMESAGYPRWYHNSDGTWTAVPTPSIARTIALSSLHARNAIPSHDQQKLQNAEKDLQNQFITPNRQSLDAAAARQLKLEQTYYALDPLYIALALFIAGFVAMVVGSLFQPENTADTRKGILQTLCGRGMRLPWALGVAGVVVLLAGMVLRTMITMRSPVGNTYETIAFIACTGVLITLVMEAVGKRGVALVAGLLLGAFGCQMGIMYEAGQASDHMDPLVAVLRSNFLLSTHVITIVLGYAAALLAGVFSHVYILSKPFNIFDPKTEDALTRMAYGTLGFSLLFTLIGTVFGGIWGNEAWGRFWGWDPKENGALIIILWQLILLHARLAGYIKVWGLHLGNIFGVLLIAFAWWGVNTLGVGLHSYGFSDAHRPLMIFYIAESVILLLSVLIWRYQSKRD